MFSYRHAFHAGNHADVLKHITLLTCLVLLQKKEVGLTFVDTHAGAGVYDLEDEYARKSAESLAGILQLHHFLASSNDPVPPAIDLYCKAIAKLNQHPLNTIRIYPGSAQLFLQFLRDQDKLRLMELHPTDYPILLENVAIFQNIVPQSKKTIQVYQKNGFSQLKAFLPPPTRRGLCLIDPSYENKEDYVSVLTTLEEAIQRFSTGVYLVWYPIIQRTEANVLPKKLEKFCQNHQLKYLQAELQIKSHIHSQGLVASGMWVINPPWQLKEQLDQTLAFLVKALGQDDYSRFTLEAHE